MTTPCRMHPPPRPLSPMHRVERRSPLSPMNNTPPRGAAGRVPSPSMVPRSPVPMGVRIGTWNMSGWSAERAEVVLRDVAVDILAVQETHLASLPLEWAHSTTRRLGLHLHHGRPCVPLPNSPHGRSCGVGFVTKMGVAVSPVLPQGTVWRHLHALRRLHAIRIPPRVGLPHGLLLLSIYAPLAERGLEVERAKFAETLQTLTHELDIQIPTLLLGDFNGSFNPARDFLRSSVRLRPPALSLALTPSRPWRRLDRPSRYIDSPTPGLDLPHLRRLWATCGLPHRPHPC